jgi:hypothetical protein
MKHHYPKFLKTAAAALFLSGAAIAQCPTITCPGNISVTTDSASCGAVVTYTTPVGDDTCASTTQTFSYTGSIVTWTVPTGVTSVNIEARGAQGGYNTNSTTQSGLGAVMAGTFSVTPGSQLQILVGEQPSASAGNGGGGGTFVVDMSNNPLIIAGGGGGSSQGVDSPDKQGQAGTSGGTGAGGGGIGGTNGNGGSIGSSGFQSGAGGGLLTNGADGWTSGTGGFAFVNGGSGGPTNAPARGGFGGGGSGSSYVVGGGGGGYSGGGSGGNSTAGVGGGGGSYNAGTSQVNTAGANSGNGSVIISYASAVNVTTTMISGLSSGSLFPVGTTTVTYVVDNGIGNTDTCSFDVVVTDNEAPQISCPGNISINTDSGMCSAVVSYVVPAGTDNCVSTTTQIAGLGSGSAFPVGTTTETYQVTDASGNTVQCSFDITVSDNEAPMITCLPPIAASADSGTCFTTVTYTAPEATDNCSISSMVLISGMGSGSSFPVGTWTETFVATDVHGNTDTCEVTITVVDNEAPSITVPANVVTCDPLVNNIGTGPVAENCTSAVGIVYTLTGATTGSGNGDASGTVFNVGVTTVTYSITDGYGNTGTFSFNVTVNPVPTATAAAAVTVACVDDAPVQLTGTPAGGMWSGPGVSGTLFQPAVASAGTHTLTYVFTNAASCSDSATVNITVNICAGITSAGEFGGISAYPNPAGENVTVEFGTMQEDVVFQLTQVNGGLVRESAHSNVEKVQLGLDGLAPGIYFLNVTNANGSAVLKLVKN